MYHRVYAPDGEPFDVTRERADSLILQEGWTQNPPQTEQTEEAITDSVMPPPKPRRVGKNSNRRSAP
jgi:hypothetical protein